jgi:hypothetical protein
VLGKKRPENILNQFRNVSITDSIEGDYIVIGLYCGNNYHFIKYKDDIYSHKCGTNGEEYHSPTLEELEFFKEYSILYTEIVYFKIE